MDILQIALVFLIVLLSVFLSVIGVQVFLILKDLRRDLNKLDKLVSEEASQIREVERVVVEKNMDDETRVQEKVTEKPALIGSTKPRFYKKVLK